MEGSIKNIFIPVSLSTNSEIVVKKALELAGNGTNIHLFHVLRYSKTNITGMLEKYFYELTQRPTFMQAEIKINELKDSMRRDRKDITVATWIAEGNTIRMEIGNKASEIGADLIIISKRSRFFLPSFLDNVNPSKLLQDTGISVVSIDTKADIKVEYRNENISGVWHGKRGFVLGEAG